jgi:hypothetical protein
MSLHEDIASDIRREIAKFDAQVDIDAAVIAASVLSTYSGGRLEPHVEYLCREHLKTMARPVLAHTYEADGEDNEAHQGDMFSGTLQSRYPLPKQKGVAPTYRLREHLTRPDAVWNAQQLEKSAAARMRHADAMWAWIDQRFTDSDATAKATV